MKQMNRSRRTGKQTLSADYPAELLEYKSGVVATFLASGKTIAEVAQEHDLTETTVREWVREAANEAAGPGTAGQNGQSNPARWAKLDTTSAEQQAEALALFMGGKAIAEIAYGLNLPESIVREWLWYAPPNAVTARATVNERKVDFFDTLDDPSFVLEIVEPGSESEGPAGLHRRGRPARRRSAPKVPAPSPAGLTEELSGAPGELEAVRAETAKALGQAEAKAAKAAKTLDRTKTNAAKAVAAAEAVAAESRAAARNEIAAAYATAVEAMVRAEVVAAEKVARVEADAAQAVAKAQAAAADAEAAGDQTQQKMASVYAEAAEAMMRAEVAADQKASRAEAAAAQAIARAEAVAAEARSEAAEMVARSEATLAEAIAQREAAAREEVAAAYAAAVEAMLRAEVTAAEAVARAEAVATEAAQVDAPAPVAATPFQVVDHETGPALDRANEEAEARAKIAEVMSRIDPIDVWVHATGRTVAEAREEALGHLGVSEAEAEFEVIAQPSRWLPGRVQIRARVRRTARTRP